MHVLQGSLTLSIGPTRVRLDPGSVGFVPPFTPYRCAKAATQPLEMINPHVTFGTGEPEAAGQRLLPPMQFRPGQLPRIHRLLKAARRSMDEPDRSSHRLWLCARVLAEIGGYLHRYGVPTADPNDETPVVASVAEWLKSQTHQKFDLDRLAQDWHLSPSHLNRCFKRVYGQTPFQFWQACRLNHVQAALLAGHAKLDELAAAFEFSDASHLSKWFRQRAGTTISSYRRATGWVV